MSLMRRLTLGRVVIVTTVLGFSVLLFGGWKMFKSKAPIPERVLGADGSLLATRAQILGGQAVYQKYGLMDWGSVLGHGTYYGADLTAEALHGRVVSMREHLARRDHGLAFENLPEGAAAAVSAAVIAEIKANAHDPATGTLRLGEAGTHAYRALLGDVRRRFVEGEPERALPPGVVSESHLPVERRGWVAPGDQIEQLAAFIHWTSWLAGAMRPDGTGTYTNNWPYDPDAGNEPSSGAMIWSGVSVAVLLLILPLVILIWMRGRYDMEDAYAEGAFPAQELSWLPVYPSQKKALKFFVAAFALFLVQTLLGGYLAHTYIEGDAFYGVQLSTLLPFQVAKTWHVQLAIFWIATAWLGMGLYVAPLLGGREPKRQGLLVDVLFGAVVLVAVGSLAGEWLGVKGLLGENWWWFGHSGWELIELGRVWQILLAVGFGLWVFLVGRAVRAAHRAQAESGNLLTLFLVAAVSIPAMFCAIFMITPGTHITMADYWRWWIIHLWVEGMFEVFAVVVLGLLLVNMGLVTRHSAARALKFQLLILLGSGIIGTGHHYYWIGANEFWIALGSIFSGLEVIPLSLLAIEAWQQWVVIKQGGHAFPYRHVFMFLMAVAIWNLVGAGVFGFLINLPIVNYFEHGSFLTANHGHAAVMGVFGMLAIALALYCTRNVASERGWRDRLFTLSFWGLNAGLAGMVALTLLPVGILQLNRAAEQGFWAARTLAFYDEPTVHLLLWLRLIPDAVFIGLGVLPLCLGMWTAFRNQRPASPVEEAVRPELRRVAPPAPDLAPAPLSRS